VFKKAQSVGKAWIFALVSFFGIGVLYITFNQVFAGHLVPTFKSIINSTAVYNMDGGATVNTIFGGIDQYMTFFHIVPFVLFFIIIIFMIVVSLKREGESQYDEGGRYQ